MVRALQSPEPRELLSAHRRLANNLLRQGLADEPAELLQFVRANENETNSRPPARRMTLELTVRLCELRGDAEQLARARAELEAFAAK